MEFHLKIWKPGWAYLNQSRGIEIPVLAPPAPIIMIEIGAIAEVQCLFAHLVTSGLILCFSLFSLLLLLLFAGLATLPTLLADSAAMRSHPTTQQASSASSLAYRWATSVTYHAPTSDNRSSTSLTTDFSSPERERMATYLNPWWISTQYALTGIFI